MGRRPVELPEGPHPEQGLSFLPRAEGRGVWAWAAGAGTATKCRVGCGG